jgi:tetraacyldisaccharide 4'-kinase
MPARAPATVRDRIAAALQRSWQSRGAFSTMLLAAAWGFRAATGFRRALFTSGARRSSRLGVPVVVVGNVLVGGAGKTPTVIAVVSLLARKGFRPAIVSRGYGRERRDVLLVDTGADVRDVGDEPLMLHRRTGVPVAVGADRAAAARALLQAHPEVDVIVSDDGLQHLGLARDVEVLVFDERGIGNGRLLPAGPLREPLPERLGARQLVVYNAERATTPLVGHLARRELVGATPLAAWWAGAAPEPGSLAKLRGHRVVAAAGIARPERFFAMLRAHGLEITELSLADHADFATLPWPSGTSEAIVTEKDAVKLAPTRALGAEVWVARLDFVPEPAFDAALLALLPPPASNDRHGNTAP